MSENLQVQLKEFLTFESGKLPESRKKSQFLALTSMTVYMYLEYMMEELERAGYDSIEFMSKCELFLKCVTPAYEKKAFEDILNILKSIDSDFPKSKFYKGLTSLRALCTGESIQSVKIMNSPNTFTEIFSNEFNGEVVFFTTYLIEIIQRSLNNFRKETSMRQKSIKELKDEIAEEFDACVMNTIMSLKNSGDDDSNKPAM